MSETSLIVLDYSRRTAVFTERATDAKENALAIAGMIGRVSSPDENAAAVDAQKELKAVIKLGKDTHKQCKAPILDIGRAIDRSTQNFVESLESEFQRIDRMIVEYQAVEEARRKAAEAARRLEEEKLLREQQEQERRIREEAESKQRKLDAERGVAEQEAINAKTAKERAEAEALQLEIGRQKELAAAKTMEQLDAVQERTNQAAAMLPKIEPIRAEGQSVGEDWVIDQIREFELMKARPDLVRRVEFDLNSIKYELKRGVRLPGVTAHKETVSKVRLGRQKAAIEIA